MGPWRPPTLCIIDRLGGSRRCASLRSCSSSVGSSCIQAGRTTDAALSRCHPDGVRRSRSESQTGAGFSYFMNRVFRSSAFPNVTSAIFDIVKKGWHGSRGFAPSPAHLTEVAHGRGDQRRSGRLDGTSADVRSAFLRSHQGGHARRSRTDACMDPAPAHRRCHRARTVRRVPLVPARTDPAVHAQRGHFLTKRKTRSGLGPGTGEAEAALECDLVGFGTLRNIPFGHRRRAIVALFSFSFSASVQAAVASARVAFPSRGW